MRVSKKTFITADAREACTEREFICLANVTKEKWTTWRAKQRPNNRRWVRRIGNPSSGRVQDLD
jgi:hypothetical protein